MNFDLQAVDPLKAALMWGGFFGGFLIVVGIISVLASLIIHGTRGIAGIVNGVAQGLMDLFSLSPRRLAALTALTFKEAVRRKALLVFVVFAVLFMFAGWFITGGTQQQKDFQTKVYVSFALRTMTWLLLPLVLLLSCWGIPEDIKQRSLHTIVTKPARRLEVVLGRMLGFGAIGTVILAVMGLVGYIWIIRQVPSEQLICRDPMFGKLTFLDREGVEGGGVNVGDLREFRKFVEGATKSRAIWTMENVDESILHPENNCFQLESRFEAFRTHKGDFNRTTFFQYTLVNPDNPSISVPLSVRQIEEFRNNADFVTVGPAIQLADATGKPLSNAEPPAGSQRDFFKDVVSNGKVQIHVSCLDPGQYVGMSRVDLFFRKPDKPFWLGYAKSLIGIECLLLLVVFIGVAASTFVKGPVATFLTACILLVGMFGQDFMDQLIMHPERPGAFTGGGVFESIYRIVTHMNPTTELPAGPAFFIMQWVDYILKLFLWSVRYYIPNCTHFMRMPEFVANGFDVLWAESLLPSILVTLGFFIPCLFIGYFSLQSRELESK